MNEENEQWANKFNEPMGPPNRANLFKLAVGMPT